MAKRFPVEKCIPQMPSDSSDWMTLPVPTYGEQPAEAVADEPDAAAVDQTETETETTETGAVADG